MRNTLSINLDLVDDKDRIKSDDEVKTELFMAIKYCIKALPGHAWTKVFDFTLDQTCGL